MHFKFDENIHPDAADELRSLGHDALTVRDEGLSGISDEELAAAIQRERRALVTFDLGFADIRRHPPPSARRVRGNRRPTLGRAASRGTTGGCDARKRTAAA